MANTGDYQRMLAIVNSYERETTRLGLLAVSSAARNVSSKLSDRIRNGEVDDPQDLLDAYSQLIAVTHQALTDLGKKDSLATKVRKGLMVRLLIEIFRELLNM